MLVLLFVAIVYSTRRFVLCLTLFSFVLVFFSPFSIAITLLWEERANLSAFRTFVRFVLVWFCWFPLPLGVREVLRFQIVAFPGLFSYLCFSSSKHHYMPLHYLNTQTDNLLSHFFLKKKKKTVSEHGCTGCLGPSCPHMRMDFFFFFKSKRSICHMQAA